MSANIIAIIPARGGSKGLPGKNLKHFMNHPLIAWPIQYAKESEINMKILVSTDDSAIASAASDYGADVPFLRPDEISQDLTTTEETLKFSLEKAEIHYQEKFDYCIFLTCTDLFRIPGWIEEGLSILKANTELESVFVASETHKNFWTIEGNKPKRYAEWMKIYSSRQIRKTSYREDTGLMSISKSCLWRNGKRIGDNVQIISDNRLETSIDIHTEFDLVLANAAVDWISKNRPLDLPPLPKKK